MRVGHCLWLSLLATTGFGQWEVPDEIRMTGTQQQDRQVTGLAPPIEGADLLSAEALRNQSVLFGNTVSVNNHYSLTLTPTPNSVPSGMVVSFSVDATNSGAATLGINGLVTGAVLKQGNVQLDSSDLRVGSIHQAIYNGNDFLLFSNDQLDCPTGYTAITRDCCITTQPADSMSWYGAAVFCASRNARLCTMSEWYKACTTIPNLSSTIVGYEWVDHAANHTNTAKTIGINAITFQPDCNDGGHASPYFPRTFRCCYTR